MDTTPVTADPLPSIPSSKGQPIPIRARRLRDLLVLLLLHHRTPMTVRELVAAVEVQGFVIADGRASKRVSDQLRWERELGRVRRPARGLYAAAHVPRRTKHRMRKRLAAFVAQRGDKGPPTEANT